MVGIYVHIPFCRHACAYCDFYFTLAINKHEEAFVRSVIAEASQRKEFFTHLAAPWGAHYAKHGIQTLYWGGGTPSLLTRHALTALSRGLRQHFLLTQLVEFTLEVNPEDLSIHNLITWRKLGVTRLSLGIQTFTQRHAKYLGRPLHAYTFSEWEEWIKAVAHHGFDINIDLMYGYLPLPEWRSNLEKALRLVRLGVNHISLYSLTVEKGTRLYHEIARGSKAAPCESLAAEELALAQQQLAQGGMEHYEIANFALPGHEAQHNLIYWEGGPYLGLGPAAHSFDGERTRTDNIRNLAYYLEFFTPAAQKTASSSKLSKLRHVTALSDRERFNDWIVTRLRGKKGIILAEFIAAFSPGQASYLVQAAQTFIDEGLLAHHKAKTATNDKDYLAQPPTPTGTLALTPRGMLFADRVMRALIVVD